MTWFSLMILALVLFMGLSDVHSGLIAIAKAIRDHDGHASHE